MIDFTGCKVLVNSYEGADFKRKIIYDGDVYMLKFGQKLESDEHKPLQASYTRVPSTIYNHSKLQNNNDGNIETHNSILGRSYPLPLWPNFSRRSLMRPVKALAKTSSARKSWKPSPTSVTRLTR